MGDLYGWIGLLVGQLVAWPQVVKLRREPSDGVSLLTYALLLLSMVLYLAHAIQIRDTVTMASVPMALIPNGLIATTLIRRRLAGSHHRAESSHVAPESTNEMGDEGETLETLRRRCATVFGRLADRCCPVPDVRGVATGAGEARHGATTPITSTGASGKAGGSVKKDGSPRRPLSRPSPTLPA